MRIMRSFCIASIIALRLSAQDPSPSNASKAHIEGIVVDGFTGNPLPDAAIRGAGTATTDVLGGFSIDINPGPQILNILKAGYAPARLEGRKLTGNTGIPLNLEPGQQQSGLVIRLFPPPVVTGKVFDHHGDPMPNAEVQPYVYLYNDAGIRMRSNLPGGPAKTNDLGDFRIENLDPGEYFFEIRPAFSDLGDTGGYILAPVFYPGTTDPSRAESVRLEPGSQTDLKAITAIPVRGRLFRVSLSNQGDEPRGATILSVFRRDETSLSFRSTLVQKDAMTQPVDFGRFPPGAYFVRAGFAGINGGTNEGRAFVDLGETNIELTLPIVKFQPWNVTGQAILETMNGEIRPVSGVSLAFYDAGPNAGNSSLRLQPPIILTSQTNGSFPRRALSPYNPPYFYRVHVLNPPPGTYVATVRGGSSTHQLQPEYGRETNLTVVLGQNAGTIVGTATDATGTPIPFGNVVLIPDDPNDFHRLVTTSTAANGTFRLQAGPGAYRLYAWRELFGAPYLDPEFRQRYQASSLSVLVEPEGQLVVNPRIISE